MADKFDGWQKGGPYPPAGVRVEVHPHCDLGLSLAIKNLSLAGVMTRHRDGSVFKPDNYPNRFDEHGYYLSAGTCRWREQRYFIVEIPA